jgi:hypothetical protein
MHFHDKESFELYQTLDIWSPATQPQELRINVFTSKSYLELKARDRTRDRKKTQKSQPATCERLDTEGQLSVESIFEGPQSPARCNKTLGRAASHTIEKSCVREAFRRTMYDDVDLAGTTIPFTQQANAAQAALGLLSCDSQAAPCLSPIFPAHASIKQGHTEPLSPPNIGNTPPATSIPFRQSSGNFTTGLECDHPLLPDSCPDEISANLDDDLNSADSIKDRNRRKEKSPLHLRNDTCLNRLDLPISGLEHEEAMKSHQPLKRAHDRHFTAAQKQRTHGLNDDRTATSVRSYLRLRAKRIPRKLSAITHHKQATTEPKKTTRDKNVKNLGSIHSLLSDKTPPRKSRCGRSIVRPRRHLPEEGYA